MRQKILKLISSILVFIILCANSATLITYAAEEFKTSEELESQGTSTNNQNVEIDVYYAGGTHTNSIDITQADAKIYIKASVKNAGYLENAKIDLSSCNFNIADDESNKGKVQQVDTKNKIVTLSKISAGNTVEIVLNIAPIKDEKIEPEMFKKDNTITITGTYTNENATQEQITKQVTLHTTWYGQASATIKQELVKYIPFSVNNKSGLLIQTEITTGVVNSLLPIEETLIQVTVPTLAEEKPVAVLVYANKTEATNGDNTGISFTSENYTYDATNGKVTINVKNIEDSNGQIYWKKNAEDKYEVVFIYSNEVASTLNQTKPEVEFSSTIQNTYYGSNQEGNVSSTTATGVSVKETLGTTKGKFVDYEALINEKSVGKGYLYNNKVTVDENKLETLYTEEYILNIGYAELIDEIIIEQKADSFVNEENEESSTIVEENNYAYNKILNVNKAEFSKILGNTGYIKIYKGTTLITEINNTSKANDNGILKVDISQYDTNNLTIKTSKPQTQGKLTIQIEKAISKNVGYTKAELEEFTKLKQNTTFTTMAGTEELEKANVEAQMNLTEPTAKAQISINKENLSTVITNEVEITAVLETDSYDDILYEDPTITINLPSYVSNINVKRAELLHSDELEAGEPEVTSTSTEKSIKINITGTQTKYNDTVTKGATLLIYADIEVEKTTSSTSSTITMEYTNNEQKAGEANTKINFVAPTGLITLNQVSNYSEDGETLISINDENKTAELKVNSSAQTAQIKGQIINNYNNTISKINILGRIPTEDSINYDSTESLGNTFNTTLVGAITLTGLESNYKIYYSTNSGATKDLSDANNNWTENVTDYSKIKSYLIVIDSEIANAKEIVWNYNLNIPGNLEYKDVIISTYKIYFDNNESSGKKEESKISPIIKLETERGPELNAQISSIDVENGGTVTNGKKIAFNITVNNTGSEKISNITLQMAIPEGTEFNDANPAFSVNWETQTIATTIYELEAKSSTTIPIKLDCIGIGNVTLVAKVLVEGTNGYLKTNEYSFNIEDADLALINSLYMTNGNSVGLGLGIRNLINEEMKNVTISYHLPEGVSYEYYEVPENLNERVEYNSDKNIVTITLEKLAANDFKNILIYIKVNIKNNNMSTYAKAIINNKEYVSNIVKIPEINLDYAVDALNPGEQYVKNGDEITSIFTIENTGDQILYDTALLYNIPEGTELVSGNIEYGNNSYTLLEDEENKGIIEYTLVQLASNEKAILSIRLKITLEEKEQEQEISSYLNISNTRLEEKKSDTLLYIVKAKEETGNVTTNEIVDNNQTNTDIVDPGDSEKKGYEINGKIWLDTNKNGNYESKEEIISGITVILINKDNEEIVLTTVTNEKGKYIFDELEKGDYIVAFLYDTSKYSVTEYQREGISKITNSDAITSNINYKDEYITVGLTDTLKITDSDINNVDLGLYETEKFDLSLSKFIKKITVNNSIDTTIYNYKSEEKEIAKVEIPEKYMASSTVIVEYKIVVKNTGTVSGYAKKIVDYIPEDLKFNSELNPRAYLGKDGNIYSEELANTIINPGESKEITLILTKAMTGNNTGTIVNTAEILQSYNELGLEDENSEEGNKNEKENDFGAANLIISVKTGQVAIYTSLTMVIITTLGIGIYLIKKYVIKEK